MGINRHKRNPTTPWNPTYVDYRSLVEDDPLQNHDRDVLLAKTLGQLPSPLQDAVYSTLSKFWCALLGWRSADRHAICLDKNIKVALGLTDFVDGMKPAQRRRARAAALAAGARLGEAQGREPVSVI